MQLAVKLADEGKTKDAVALLRQQAAKNAAAPPAIQVPGVKEENQSLEAAATYLEAKHLRSVFLVSDPWHNARIKRMASDLGLDAHASATWTSAYQSHGTRLAGYLRETFAYLYYRVVGGR